MNATSTIGIKLALDGASQAEAQLGRLGGSMQKLGSAADGIRSSLGGLAAGFAGVVSVQQFMQAADAVTALQNNLRLATGSTTAAAQAFDGLFQAAQRSRTSFTELGNTYASIARASESLKLSQTQLLTLTETIGNAVTVSGASAQASQAALVQLGQGLASGTLRGEELNSILEQTPRLAKALADGLGVSTGALRELGSQGKLTAEAVVQALQSQQKVLAEEVRTSVTTVGQAYTQLQNAATALVGTIDTATGSSNGMAQAIQAVATSLGDIQSAFKGSTAAGSEYADLFGAGISTVFETVAVLGANVAYVIKAIRDELGGIGAQAVAVAKGQFSEAAEIGRLMRADAEKARQDIDALSERIVRARQLRKLADTANAGLDFSAENARLNRQAGNTVAKPLDFSKLGKDAKDAKKEVDEFAAALDRVLGKEAGLNSDYTKTLAALFEGYEKGRISAEGYADAVAKLISQQPFVKQGLEEQAKAAAYANEQWDDLFEAQEKARLANEKQIETARTYLDQVQFETQLLGMNAEQRALATAVRELESQGIKEGTQAYAAYIEKIKEAIRLREGKAAEIKAAEDAAAAWKKASDEIERSLTDALMRGFESGKGFAEVLRDTVANMFKTLVLRPVIQATVQGGISAIGLGPAGGANGLLGNMASNYATSTLGASVFGSSAAYGAALGTTSVGAGSQAAMLAAQTGEFGLAGLTATSGAAGGAMASIGAALPYIGAALAVASLISSLDDSGTMHTGGLGGYSAAGGTITGAATGLRFGVDAKDYTASAEKASADMAKAIVGLLDSTAQTFGQEAGYYAATAFADDTSKDGAWGALMLKMGNKVLLDWGNNPSAEGDANVPRIFANGEQGAKEYAVAVATDVRDYLITQTPDWADAMLAALGDAPTIEALAATVQQINAAAAAMDAMGQASAAFAALADDATSALVKALGGAEAAVAKLNGYYGNFYTEAERTAQATAKLTGQLAELGVALPASRDAFRALVDAALAVGDADKAAKLIDLSGAFASITTAASTAAAGVASAAGVITSVADAQKQALDQLKNSVSEEKAIWQRQAEAASTLRDEVQGIFDTLTTSITDLRAEVAGPVQTAAQGRDFLATAMAQAQSGVGLPDATALGNAIAAARGGLGMENFASVAEQKFATATLAGQLEGLQKEAGSQLSVAEQMLTNAESQLARLDDTLEYWEQQVSLSQGGIDATITVEQAVRDLIEAIKDPTGAKKDAKTEVKANFNQPGYSSSAYRKSLEDVPEWARDNYVKVGDRYINIDPQELGVSAQDYYAARLTSAYWSPEADMRSTFDQLAQNSFAGSAEALLAAAAAAGIDPNIISSYRDEFLTKYDVGTPFVPKDGPAYLHKGEMVVPAAYNPAVHGSPQANNAANAAMRAELAEQRQQLQNLNALMADMARSARRTADAVNGNPEVPMLVATV